MTFSYLYFTRFAHTREYIEHSMVYCANLAKQFALVRLNNTCSNKTPFVSSIQADFSFYGGSVYLAFLEIRIQAVMKIGLCCGDFTAADFSLANPYAAGGLLYMYFFLSRSHCLLKVGKAYRVIVTQWSKVHICCHAKNINLVYSRKS